MAPKNMACRHSRAHRHADARGTYLVRRRHVGAELQQRLHHRSMPAIGGFVQAGVPELVGMFEIGASQQHRGQTGRHSEARKHQEEHVLVLVGDVDLRKVLRKRGLDLLCLDLNRSS